MQTKSDTVLDCYDILGSTNMADFRWLHWLGPPPVKANMKLVKNAAYLSDRYNGSIIETKHYNTTKIQINNKNHHGVLLILKNVTESDNGWYSCVACNHVGCTMSSAYLTVRDGTGAF